MTGHQATTVEGMGVEGLLFVLTTVLTAMTFPGLCLMVRMLTSFQGSVDFDGKFRLSFCFSHCLLNRILFSHIFLLLV